MGLFSFSMGTERVKKSEAFLRIGGLFFGIFFLRFLKWVFGGRVRRMRVGVF